MTINSKALMTTLRRDAHFVTNAVIATVFVCFVTLALVAAVLDLIAIAR